MSFRWLLLVELNCFPIWWFLHFYLGRLDCPEIISALLIVRMKKTLTLCFQIIWINWRECPYSTNISIMKLIISNLTFLACIQSKLHHPPLYCICSMSRRVLLLALENLQTTVKVLSQSVFGLTMNSEVPRIGLLDSQTGSFSSTWYWVWKS